CACRSAWSSPARLTPRAAIRPAAGDFQMALLAGRPRYSNSRTAPTLTERTFPTEVAIRFPPSSTASFRRFQGVGRIGLVPLHVAGRAVDRGDRLVPGQPQPRLDLGSVVAGVQDAPPEYPDPLPAQAAEEGPALQPPGDGP